MTVDTWAVVIATAVGPISAVLITRRLEMRREDSLRKHWVFTVLMGLRGAVLNAEHVRALNVVQVHFHRDQKVIDAWKRLVAHMETKATDEAGWITWNEKHRDLLSGLLTEMSITLNIPLDSVDLKRGGYVPQAWTDRENGENARLFVYRSLADAIRDGLFDEIAANNSLLEALLSQVKQKPRSKSFPKPHE